MSLLTSGLAQPEGPVAMPGGDVACVEMAHDAACVTRIAPDGTRTVIARTGGRPNGLAIDGAGCFWVAGGPPRSVARYDAQGRLLLKTEGSAGRPFLFPNDLAFGSDGTLYLTDSGWLSQDLGRNGAMRADFRDLPFDGAVIRVDPVSASSTVVARGLRFANGIAFGPDGALFANESVTGAILRIEPDGRTVPYANVREGVADAGFGPDGMAFAADGTLYCAVYGAGHIAVIPPGGGAVSARIATPGKAPTNVAFARDGAPILYVTEVERGELLRLPIDRAGLPLHEPLLA